MDNLDDILPDIEAGVEELIDTLNSIDNRLDSINKKLDKIGKQGR